jgi:alkyldihydroxyacetonephosphate synthase
VTDVLEALRRELGDAVRSDAATLAAHAADAWVMAELDALEHAPRATPLAVLEPASTEGVSRALALCRSLGVAVVPIGARSGVCGAIAPETGSVALSTRRLAGLRRLDSDDLLAVFGAGTLGIDAERALEPHGLTLGHWPQSIEISSVGGWVATRASGQFSTANGSIEDLVLALEVVLGDGSVLRTRETPRAAAGPDLRQLFLGSEGTLGVVTEVTFSVRARAEASRGQAFHFDDFRTGVEPIRRALRAGWRPPVARLYDARESRRNFRDFVPKDRALLLLLHEGPASAVAAESEALARLCREAGGVETDAAAVEQWMGHRNRVPSFRSFLEQGVVVDTIEVAATWSRVGALYEGVTAALSRVPGVLSATAHSSHSYRSGTCLYFSFAAKPADASRLRDTYAACWRAAMEATLAAGGGIAHHHGIGRVRRPWLADEIGATGVTVLRALKHALDPGALLNPGNLIP